MCEVIIRWTEKVPQGDPQYAYNFHPGDVIEVMPDGYDWAQSSLTNPNWRIIKLPNVPATLIMYLLDIDEDVVTKMFKNKRKHFLDGVKIPSNVRNQINNNQVLTSNIQGTTLLNWITQRVS